MKKDLSTFFLVPLYVLERESLLIRYISSFCKSLKDSLVGYFKKPLVRSIQIYLVNVIWRMNNLEISTNCSKKLTQFVQSISFKSLKLNLMEILKFSFKCQRLGLSEKREGFIKFRDFHILIFVLFLVP